MRYERAGDVVRLAIRLQGSRGGLTIADIQEEFSVSRRTAERMRNAVEATFGPLETVGTDTGDRRIRWHLRSAALYSFIQISPEELAGLEAAVGSLGRTGLAEHAGKLRDLAVKLRAISHRHSREEFDAALASLMEAEGLAMRAGPRENLEGGLLALVRDAITSRRKLEFDYFSRKGAAEPPAGAAVRRALRQPRVPRGTNRPGKGSHALAARERNTGQDH